MADISAHERMRQTRIERGEDLASLAKRTGIREGLLQAIEDGRFAELPRGIYGRAAVRSFASALGLDPTEVLTACDPLLAPMDDPIDALARLRGVRHAPKPGAPSEPAPVPSSSPGEPFIAWKPLAAAAIDGGIIMGLVLALLVITMIFCGAPPSGFQRMAAPAFGLMGILLGGCYFICFAGIAGATMGERITGLSLAPQDRRSHDGHAVLTRALRGVLRDALCIRSLGDALARVGGGWHARMHSPTTSA
jgi:hypothetical protein